MPKEERVNHPQHYQTGGGIEVIDVIRHYTCDIANALKYLMRAGRKQEADMTSREKETEDLQKALWYIEDYRTKVLPTERCRIETYYRIGAEIIPAVTGYQMDRIYNSGSHADIIHAINLLLTTGIIMNGVVYRPREADDDLEQAALSIRQRIASLEAESLKS